MAKSSKKKYTVMGKIDVVVYIEMEADTLKEAVEAACALKSDDFIRVMGEHVDSETTITGVYES